VAYSHLEILMTEINEHLRSINESWCDLAETIAITRKSISESQALLAGVAAAILAKR
jgi:hypothetical protein